MTKEQLKADLTLLKRYVKEIEEGLEQAYLIRDEPKPGSNMKEEYQKFMIKLYNVVGLLAGITTESGLLVGDLQKIAQYSEPNSKGASDPLSALQNILLPSKNGRGEN